MFSNLSSTFRMRCTACGHVNTITFANSIDPNAPVNCAACSGSLDLLGNRLVDDEDLVATAPRRRRMPEVDAGRRAMALARPYAVMFEDWNNRAARSNATLPARIMSEAEKNQQRQALSVLHGEISTAFTAFEAAIAKQPGHGRLIDMRSAFVRLLSLLERAIA